MGKLSCLLSIFLGVFIPFVLVLVKCETYSVKIGTDKYVNVVSKHFLSFTVDPKYLFSSSEKYNSQECICMAASLTPAYIRIAGPSTAHMSFRNTTITIDNTDDQPRKLLSNLLGRNKKRHAVEKLQVASDQWIRFAKWAKSTGFEIVFALNNAERTKSGMWDPNRTMDILSVAEKAGIKDVFWQLGYECIDQTIDDYLTDLETLRVVVESFRGGGRAGGGDVTRCLRARARSDFKDYVALALGLSDAVLLDANSSSHELDRLSPPERQRLLKLLHTSSTPLWLTERPQQQDELPRAAEWLASLGYSARNGFAVHYRELSERELYHPTLSFYMALLFKNLVGERVLTVDIDSSEVLLFAHCTSLRRQPVSGAITLYGVNMDDEPARLSVKLSKQEAGGDILQFILSQDDDGNIIVNDRLMTQEGDMRQVVKRVRAYKNLLINLPAKSFGFWVIANTTFEACRDFKDEENLLGPVPAEDDDNEDVAKETKTVNMRRKRATDSEDLNEYYVADITQFDENNDLRLENKEWNDKIADLNNYLQNVHRFLRNKSISRTKRQMYDENLTTKKLRRQLLKTRKDLKLTGGERRPIMHFVEHLLQLTRRNDTKYLNKIRHTLKMQKGKIGNRNYKINKDQKPDNNRKLSRPRRSLESNKHISLYDDHEDLVKDNEIEVDDTENKMLWKLLHTIQSQLEKISEDESEKSQDSETDDDGQKSESVKLEVKPEVSDDNASNDLSEKLNYGLLKTTFDKLFSALAELNTHLSRFWEAVTFFE